MRNILFFCTIICFLTACTNNSGKESSPAKLREQVIRLAENHIRNQLKDAKLTTTKDSLIVLSDNEMKWLIDPHYILLGQIDEDTIPDAIVSIFGFRDQALAEEEHLIIINKEGMPAISKVLDGKMKFLAIKDKTIYIETSKIASDSPMYGCKICKEVNRYKFIGGDTVRVK